MGGQGQETPPPFCFTSLCPLCRNVFDVFLLEGEKLIAFFSSGLLPKFSLSSSKTVIHEYFCPLKLFLHLQRMDDERAPVPGQG